MRKLLISILLVVMIAASVDAALTYDLSYYLSRRGQLGSGTPADPLYGFINEVEGIIEDAGLEGGDTYTFDNGGTISNATNGYITIGEASEDLQFRFTSNNVELASSTGLLSVDFNDLYITFNEISSPTGNPSSNQGWLYVMDNAATTTLYFEDSAGTQTNLLTVGGGVTLDGAYDQGGAGAGRSIDADSGAVAITVSDTDNNVALIVTQNDVTNDPTAMQIVSTANAANAISLDIDGQSTGRDIEGTGASFYVEGDGSIVGTDLDVTGAGGITLQNDETILNDTDNEIQFGNGTEDISFNFATSNTLTLTTDSGVDTIALGDIDALTGVGGITFDAAASTITLAADGSADDLTISVTGAQDASLVLSSAGTGADAITLNASAGGIDITSQNDIDITTTGAAGEDITIQNAGGSIIIEATEGATDAIVLNASTAAGGIDITSNADIDITTTGAAGEDITISNAGGSIIIAATENVDGAIDIGLNGGTTEELNIHVDQGTAEDSIDIDSTAGGIDIDYATGKNMTITGGQFSVTSNEAVASAIALTTNTGAAETIVVTNTQGTGAGAITLAATAGGVNIDAAAALDVAIDGGQVLIGSKDNAASAIALTTNQGTSETIVITNTQGTGATAIDLNATAGGVDIDAAATLDVDISGGQVLLSSKDNAASAIALTTNQGSSETIVITNTQGTDAAAINLVATAGRITLNSGNGSVVFTNGQTRKLLIPIEDVELDGANPPSVAQNGTNGQAVFPSLEFDADGGATGDDIVFIHWVVPDGYVTDSARLNVYWSFDTAEDAADECSFDFAVNAVAEGEVLDAAGTAGDAVTTVVADASADNGKMFKEQINIEVEDIVIGDLVTILFFVDESASLMAASGTADVHYFEIEWESTE